MAPPNTETQTANQPSDIAAAVAAGVEITALEDRYEIVDLGNGQKVALATSKSGQPFVMADLDKYLHSASLAPPRRTGQAVLHELDSFVEYVNRFKIPDRSTVWANVGGFQVVAILDDHPAGDDPSKCGWGEHRATYTCPRSPEWIAWTEKDGRAMSQEAFAQFLEDRLDDIAGAPGYPQAAELLEMAKKLTINLSSRFKKHIDPTTGTGVLISESEHGGDSTKIPRAFKLGLRVFEGGARWSIEARIRFAMDNGKPVFSYQLHRRVEVERESFGEVRKRVAAECSLPVLAGVP